ncbi:MAG: FtsX-like permease family protein [Thermoflexales bacterium]|nr:FtsX-like permease family protein [Thermoflexales bacterium]
MRSLHSLALRNLGAHPSRTILTALAVALGVAMVLAASIIGQAASGSASQLAEDKSRIDLEVAARDGAPFDASTRDTVRASPSVEQAAPSLRLKANTQIGELTLLGVEPSSYLALHKLELANGAFLDAPDSIVLPMALALDHSLNIGDELVVSTPAHTATLRIAGRLQIEQDIQSLADQTTAFVPLETLRALRSTSKPSAGGKDSKGLWIDRIEVALRPGADVDEAKAELAQALGDQFVIARGVPERGPALAGNTLLVQAGLAIVGLIILLAASFVILNAFGMSITARTREIGALRALGMTRRQVMNMVLAEAGLLGSAGVVAGVLVGLGLAWGVMRAMGILQGAPFSVPAWSVALSMAMGLAVTLSAALQPAWRASRVPPIVAVRPEGEPLARRGTQTPRRRLSRVGVALLGLASVGIAAFGLLARPSIFVAQAAMVVGQAALLGAAVLLLPALVGPINAACRPVLVRWLGTAGRLASDNIGRNKSRAALTAGALTAGLTIIVATSGLMTAALKGALGRLGLMLHENTFITVDIASVISSGDMSVENFFQYISENPDFDLQPVIRALDPLVQEGVIQIERCRFAPVPPELGSVPGAPGIFVDVEPFLQIGNFEFHEGDPETALRLMRRGRAALVPPIVAERLGVKVGDSFPLQTPHGELAFTVAGIGGSGWMMTVLPYTDGQAYFDINAPTHIGIIVNRGQDVDAAMLRVRQALEPFPTMAMSADYNGVFDPLMEMADRLSSLLNALVLLAVVVAALGVVNTMVINVSERGRELGLLRAVGATQRQVRQAVVAEAAVLGLLAAVVADGLGLLMVLTFGALILPNGTSSIGVRGDWQTIQMTLGAGLRDWGLAAVGALIFGPLVASLAAYYPARQAAAMDVVEATRGEQASLKPLSVRRQMSGTRHVSRLPSRRTEGFTFSISLSLAWRNLQEHRARTVLSMLAVALAVAMTIAADVISRSLITLLTQVEDVKAVAAGLFGQVDTVLGMIGLAVSAAAGFMVLNAFLMSITQRRRQIGVLRSLGMTRGQVMHLVLVEALLVGGAGTLLGVVGGFPFAWLVQALLKAFGGPMFSAWSGGASSPGRVLFGAGLGLGTSLAAVLIPAWRAARVSPLEALRSSDQRPSTTGRVRLARSSYLIGTLSLVAMLVWLVIAPPGEWVWYPLDLALTVVCMLLWLCALGLVLPQMINAAAGLARRPLARWWGAAGRLSADNLGRGSARGRVMLTIVTLAVGLTMMVGLTGGLAFLFDELFGPTFRRTANQQIFVVATFDPRQGVAAYVDMESMRLPPGAARSIESTVGSDGAVLQWNFVIAPEIAFFPNYFSFVLSPQDVRTTRDWIFVFGQGDWERALPILEKGCGVLLSPLVARNNGVGLYEHLTITGKRGPLDCVVAGIGQPYVNASIISASVRDAFELSEPFTLVIMPTPQADRQQLVAEVQAVAERYGLFLIDLDNFNQTIAQVTDQLGAVASALLLLAILAAALGVVNTTLISIAERRRELGLLRAVGATRRQALTVVTGEAALMGLLGGVWGLAAGLGLVVILATVYGGNAWGVPELDVWAAAWRSVQAALATGLVGLAAAPLVCAVAAWLPARTILRGPAIETMAISQSAARRSVSPQHAAIGAIQKRLALGTAVLMLVASAGLIAVVARHARGYLAQLTFDKARQLAAVNAGTVELSLPKRARRLDWNTLRGSGAFGNDQSLSQFKSFKARLQRNGLLDFSIADHDDIVLVNMDIKKIGQLAPPFQAPDQVSVFLEDKNGRPVVQAAAPIHNQDGQILGSVRVTLDAHSLDDLQSRLWSTLGGVGLAMAALGVLVSLALCSPLARAAQRRAGGQATPFEELPGRGLGRVKAAFSVQTRLTIALMVLVTVMVGVLECVAIPIERYHVEAMLKSNWTVWIEWMAHALSNSDLNLATLMRGRTPSPVEMMDLAQSLDLERLQQVSDDALGEDVAYMALVNKQGEIMLSDQLALIDEAVAVPAETTIQEDTWRNESVWSISTPLRQGEGGKQLGTLRIAVRRQSVEDFLDASRKLFALCGVMAVLAGVLMAQAIGGAVAAKTQS